MLLKKSFLVFAVLLPFVFCSASQVHETFKPDTEIVINQTPDLEIPDQITENQASILLTHDILAYYGHPSSRNMGILGRHSIEELDKMLTELAAEYEAAGGKKIQKAFYIIFGTVWPEGEIGILRESILMPYIEYGIENNILVFIDHQIGRYDPIDSLKRMLPYLRYPNVHLHSIRNGVQQDRW